jgi:hypothetical protein
VRNSSHFELIRRFFFGSGTGSSLEVCEVTMRNGKVLGVISSSLLLRNVLKFSLQFPAGDMQLTSTERYSLDSTRVATKLGPVRQCECQLSFAPLFSSIRALEKNYLKFSLEFPAGHMELSLNGHCFFYSEPNAKKRGADNLGKCQLSFALLFSSIRTFPAKITISNFRSNSRRGTCNF